jgi:hypothetical protein
VSVFHITADRDEIWLIADISADAGAVAGMELGRPCDEAASSVERPKAWDCID